MGSKTPTQHRYANVRSSDDFNDLDLTEKSLQTIPTQRSVWPLSKFVKVAASLALGLIAIVTCFAVGYSCGYHSHDAGSAATSPEAVSPLHSSSTCTEPAIRKEWRSLSNDEKQNYIDAFQCFIDSPSMLGMNGSLYNDFSWVHNLVAHGTHGKAPFLTWHRRFIWVYEKTLQEKCNYQGALPFWDWTLDWETLPVSPIFAPGPFGFGTDGNSSATKYQNSHCVTDHPFKNLTPLWHGSDYDPHCLTRSYAEDWGGKFVRPDAVSKVLEKETYEDFFLALEMRTHDIIPMGAGGDFTVFTAPNDPVFYLHHVQLDRLWWIWQMRDKENRLHSYGGAGEGDQNVTMSDMIPLAGLAKDIAVSDIMNTEGGELCYRYMYM